MTQTFETLSPNYIMDIKTSSISCWTFWIPAGGSSYSAPSASNTATISEFLFLKVSFASIRKFFLLSVHGLCDGNQSRITFASGQA